MDRVRLGKTELVVNRNGFGALPVQRTGMEDALRLLRRAYDGGIDFFDTARFYTDSEEKIGKALSDVRDRIVLATKTMAQTAEVFRRELDQSLSALRTDYIDIYQFHNPAFCPMPGDQSGLYDAMIEAKAQGKIRFIGITNHRLPVAKEAVESGLYDTLQFPFSYLSADADLALAGACAEKDMGFIAMKALSGGLITRSDVAYAFISQYSNVEPIWGIQRESELDEFLSYQQSAPVLSDPMKERIEKDRAELGSEFCRGCGYCMPCPVGIEISNCARMSLLLRRAPLSVYLSEEWKRKMKKIEECINCGRCKSKCPYGLNTPDLLRRNYEDYKTFV